MNQDLTTGKADRVLWKFCLPLFGSILFQQLYNIADSFVAGKFINNNALAAVGNSYEITLIFLAFAFGCNIGCSVLVAQLFGAKRYNDVRTVIYTTLIASGALCILLMVLGTCFCDQLLELIHTPKELFDASKKYLDIYIYSLPFVFYYNVATGIFSALGDSKTPFYFLACSSLANIGMDILFVAKFHMHVEGVAWAPSSVRASVVCWRFCLSFAASNPFRLRGIVRFFPGDGSATFPSLPFRVFCSRASFPSGMSSFRASSTTSAPTPLRAIPRPSS